VQPGLSEEFIGGRGVGEGVGGVVGCEQVLDDGAGFPEGDVGVVGVGDGGDAAVGVDGFEGFWRILLLGLALDSLSVSSSTRGSRGLQPTLVQNAKVHELGLVGDVQLVEDDGDFPWVGAL
jgi:hypothetical protein